MLADISVMAISSRVSGLETHLKKKKVNLQVNKKLSIQLGDFIRFDFFKKERRLVHICAIQ